VEWARDKVVDSISRADFHAFFAAKNFGRSKERMGVVVNRRRGIIIWMRVVKNRSSIVKKKPQAQ
jgi:hypothetical protein